MDGNVVMVLSIKEAAMKETTVLHPIAAGTAQAEKSLATALGYFSQSKGNGELEELAISAMKFADRAMFLFEEAQRLADAGKPHAMKAARAATMLESAEQTLKEASIVFGNEGSS
jgi:hypothetical protein